MLFAWALLAVRVTFFPLQIIFYDWYGTSNFVPFASMVQLITETPLQTALLNIVGNLLLFMPFGFLMPVLFERLRSAPAVLWRAFAVSLAIEVVQIATRARATDVDDIIINVAGAMAGYVVYLVFDWVLRRSGALGRLLDRVGAVPAGEPLVPAAFLAAATAAITVPFIVASIFGSTLGDGADGIESDATAKWPGSTVAATTGAGGYHFVIVQNRDGLGMVEYERVMPGRYTWVGTRDPAGTEGSHFDWSVSAFNIVREELPAVAVWGVNQAGASRVVVTGNGVEVELSITEGEFASSFLFDVYADIEDDDGIMDEFDLRFFTPAGEDVSDQFTSLRGV